MCLSVSNQLPTVTSQNFGEGSLPPRYVIREITVLPCAEDRGGERGRVDDTTAAPLRTSGMVVKHRTDTTEKGRTTNDQSHIRRLRSNVVGSCVLYSIHFEDENESLGRSYKEKPKNDCDKQRNCGGKSEIMEKIR